MDARQRKQITEEFFHYRHLTQAHLWDQYSAYEHWAKIEVPKDKDELAALQARLRKRFPVDAYNKARNELDPDHILSNNVLEKLLPVAGTVMSVNPACHILASVSLAVEWWWSFI
ncbi:UNVERIFIED_CONTAM: L-galactono-1,4-lactone dehydrogenase, mitochondrial [Sesamum angustifolium]|uniref:L-galactono-1,4-lactone dehydrogenase, mitochondrial n=1 Tax=Sesamum angustifolium TaxID=2727405 RepID=A0AAW2PVU4_9LAMI